MQLNWNDIEKDMPLYLLVPFSDENNDIYYEYQESKVICTKPYTDRKGNVLAATKTGYSIELYKTKTDNESLNNTILKMVKLLVQV